MNRNMKKERVTWYLCYYVSTTVLYRYYIDIYMLVILPNVWYRCIYIFWGKSKHTHVRVQTRTISYMHGCLPSCIPINMETSPNTRCLLWLVLVLCDLTVQTLLLSSVCFLVRIVMECISKYNVPLMTFICSEWHNCWNFAIIN